MAKSKRHKKYKDFKQFNQEDSLPKKIINIGNMYKVEPLNDVQREVFDIWKNTEKNLFLKGSAGTGKSFMALALALEEILSGDSPYDKVIIVNPAQSAKDLGFLPGTFEEKIEVFKEPYIAICNDLFSIKNSYKNLEDSGIIEFTTVSFLRGMTFSRAIIIIEEAQNLTIEQANTIITRAGQYTRLIINGDCKQTDLYMRNQSSGWKQINDILEDMDEYFHITSFGHNEIVRSGLVKDWIIAKEKLGY